MRRSRTLGPGITTLVRGAVVLGCAAWIACSSSEDGTGGAGTSGGTTGGTLGAGAGGVAGTQAGAGGAASGGSGGASAGSGGAAADAGTHDAGAVVDGGEVDAGGMLPSATVCREPTPATSAGNACPSSEPVTLVATELSTSFEVPVFVAHAPGDTSRIYVVERRGNVRIVDPSDGSVLGTLLELESQTLAASSTNGEYGLLGMAFHPDFPRDPRIFVNYTTGPSTAAMSTVIASFEVSEGDPDSVDVATRQVLYEYTQPQSNHNGGMVAFGPDGCLYVGSGDGGNANDFGPGHALGGNGQDLSTPLGKLLRFDADAPASSAPGNLASASNPHVFAYGLRNPWRFSFDRDTGELYIGDVGQNLYEEVHVAARGVGHQNFGWPIMEGLHCLGGSCSMQGLELPVVEHPHTFDDDCIVGGYVYRGARIPSLRGFYVYGDNGPGGSIRAFVWDGSAACAEPILLSERDGIDVLGDISSFGEDAAGELYVTTVSGALYRLEPAP